MCHAPRPRVAHVLCSTIREGRLPRSPLTAGMRVAREHDGAHHAWSRAYVCMTAVAHRQEPTGHLDVA
eukprot:13355726-Alexandrium_andersonii.AAC.1